MRIAIIGAGLAGTACAYILKRAGLEPVIYEAGDSIAPGASGNPIALYNPRLSAEPGFYSEAFVRALETFETLGGGIEWNRCGALHLITDDTKRKRFEKAAQTWRGVRMELVNAAQASAIAGIEITHDALWLTDSGTISPKKLCERYAQGIEIHLNTKIEKISDIKADAVILACGMGIMQFDEARHIALKPVRGQITQVKATTTSQKLKCNLCYGGYFSPAQNGEHIVGATFQRWLDHSEIIDEDDAGNIAKLAAVAPLLAQGLQITGHRAAVRATTKDHMPVIEKISGNLYVSAGHGSHGVLSSLMGASILSPPRRRGSGNK